MISIQDWRSEGRFFDYQGHRIFCKDNYKELLPCLIMIHGFPTASWDWHKVWEPLSNSFRIITLDMIGFGLSDKPKSFAYSINTQADIFEAFTHELGISHYHILAHDYGDTVAQELIARQIERGTTDKIDSVCLLNGGLFPETHKPLPVQKLLLSSIGFLVSKFVSFGKFSKNLKSICTKPLSDDELLAFWMLIRNNNGTAIMHKLIHYMTERRTKRDRWVGALQAYPGPLRLINGLDDPISGAHMVTRYEQLIASADVVGLPGVGHYPQVEAPEDVIESYLEFAKKIDAIRDDSQR